MFEGNLDSDSLIALHEIPGPSRDLQEKGGERRRVDYLVEGNTEGECDSSVVRGPWIWAR